MCSNLTVYNSLPTGRYTIWWIIEYENILVKENSNQCYSFSLTLLMYFCFRGIIELFTVNEMLNQTDTTVFSHHFHFYVLWQTVFWLYNCFALSKKNKKKIIPACRRNNKLYWKYFKSLSKVHNSRYNTDIMLIYFLNLSFQTFLRNRGSVMSCYFRSTVLNRV